MYLAVPLSVVPLSILQEMSFTNSPTIAIGTNLLVVNDFWNEQPLTSVTLNKYVVFAANPKKVSEPKLSKGAGYSISYFAIA